MENKKQTNHKKTVPSKKVGHTTPRPDKQQLQREFIATAQGMLDRYKLKNKPLAGGVRNNVGQTPGGHNISGTLKRTREGRLIGLTPEALNKIKEGGSVIATVHHLKEHQGTLSTHMFSNVPREPSEERVRAWLARSGSGHRPISSNPWEAGSSGLGQIAQGDCNLNRIDVSGQNRVRVHVANLDELPPSKRPHLNPTDNCKLIPLKLQEAHILCGPVTTDNEETLGRHRGPVTINHQVHIQKPDCLSTSRESGEAVKLAIIAENYPQENIVSENLLSIQSFVTEKLEETPDPLPVLTVSAGVVAGILYVSCKDSAAAHWLWAAVNGAQLGDLKLKVLDSNNLPKPVKMSWYSRNSALADDARAMKMLQRLNPNLKTNTWMLIDKLVEGTKIRRTILMDKISADTIKAAGYHLPGGLEYCKFKYLEEHKEDVFTYWDEAEAPEEPLNETELEILQDIQIGRSDCEQETGVNKDSDVTNKENSSQKITSSAEEIEKSGEKEIIDKQNIENENEVEKECSGRIESEAVVEKGDSQKKQGEVERQDEKAEVVSDQKNDGDTCKKMFGNIEKEENCVEKEIQGEKTNLQREVNDVVCVMFHNQKKMFPGNIEVMNLSSKNSVSDVENLGSNKEK